MRLLGAALRWSSPLWLALVACGGGSGGGAADTGGDVIVALDFRGADEGLGDVGGAEAEPPLESVAVEDPPFGEPRTVLKDAALVEVRDVSYVSLEAREGALEPILIRGFLARPLGAGTTQGVIAAHGLGGCARENDATGPAALLGMTVLAYTGPGGGGVEGCVASEGLPAGDQGGYRMFDTTPDSRGSWFWGHAVAAMRGLTCLAARPDVDPDRLGMTG